MKAVLAILLLLPLASAEVLEVDPSTVDPGGQVIFALAFPDDARGEAMLEVGDGRTETINTAVSEVDLPLAAPQSPGSYTARVTFQTSAGEQIHEAKYTVAGDQGAPLPVWIGLVMVALAAAWRR